MLDIKDSNINSRGLRIFKIFSNLKESAFKNGQNYIGFNKLSNGFY
jgi:hypothetical protein